MKTSFLSIVLSSFLSCSLTNAQWVQIGNTSMAQSSSICINGDNIFVGTGGNGIFRSSNNGDSWETVNNGLPLNSIQAMANNNGRLFASTYYDLITSTDNGNLWVPYYNGLGSGYPAYDFLIEGDSIFAAGFGVYFSSDNGVNWIRYTNGLPSNLVVRSITRKGNKLFIATVNGVYFSEDNGLTWNEAGAGLSNYKLWAIITSGNNILAGTDTSGIFISIDDGINWTKIQNEFSQAQVRSFIKYNGSILAGFGFGWGIYQSSDDGFTWTNIGQGLAPLYTFVVDIQANSSYLFAAGGATGLFRKHSGTTDVDYSPFEIPLKFSIEQNYPNPFNPTTTIGWQSPVGSHQTLKIYDVLGNEVVTLVNEFREAGRYEKTFNASQLSSGIYFYKLQAGNFTETRKMILIK